MGMTIDKAISHLYTYSTTMGSGQTTQEQHEDAKRVAIDIMRKYQKIQKIVSDFREYQKGISCGFGGATYMQMVSEVVEDGKID